MHSPAELENELINIVKDRLHWLAIPKGSFDIKSDIARGSLQETAKKNRLKTVTAVSINETWSALRLNANR